MKKALIYLVLGILGLLLFGYLLDTYAEPGCPHPKCCTKEVKTYAEQQVCDQGT